MIRSSAGIFILAFLLPKGAHADDVSQTFAVTLERCGDVKAEEVQAALAIEYQEEEFGNTRLTVKCWGEAATLRIIGPSRPRGRIADVSLQGVLPVAKSRTIAVLAAELWTAPDPNEAHASDRAAPSSTMVVAEGTATPKVARPMPTYRNRFGAGVSMLSSRRSINAGRSQNSSYGARGDFAALAISADYPALRWLGFFAKLSASVPITMAGHAELNAPVRWRRSEIGAYVPVWRRGVRVDLRLSFGTDTITSQNVYVRNSKRVLLPRYGHTSLGADLAYAANKKINVLVSASLYSAFTTDYEYHDLTGYRWGAGLQYQAWQHLRADARLEGSTLSGASKSVGPGSAGNGYQDDSISLSLALHYTL